MGPKQSVWWVVLYLGRIQNPDKSGGSNPGSVSDVTLPDSLLLQSIRIVMEAITERKTASHVMMLWKYKPLSQDDAL
jgi:hypothetical protein